MTEDTTFSNGNDRIKRLAERPDLADAVARVRQGMEDADADAQIRRGMEDSDRTPPDLGERPI